MISKKFFDGLSAEEQQWVKESFAVMQKFQRDKIRNNEAMILEKFKEMGGEVIELSPEERQRWIDATAKVAPMFSKEVPPELIEEMKKTVAGQ